MLHDNQLFSNGNPELHIPLLSRESPSRQDHSGYPSSYRRTCIAYRNPYTHYFIAYDILRDHEKIHRGINDGRDPASFEGLRGKGS